MFADPSEQQKANYYYAIVNGINPASPHVPKCKVVKSVHEFEAKETLISKDRNMYYKNTRSKLEEIGEDKLVKIRQQIGNVFELVRTPDLLPCSWDAYYYFCIKQQKLWD